MADFNSYTKPQQQLKDQNHANPSKLFTHFVYKAALVTVFLVIIPLFPSQAPEFINQTLLTRGWELLHLLFVGIAVCYGLFSRRNDDSDKENNHSKFDTAHSYVSKFLQVSSVFDDEAETTPSGSDHSDDTKVQTWSNQYCRNEPPVVVVAKQHSVLAEEQFVSTGSKIGDKPLLLPVRSLKSRILDSDGVDTKSTSVSRSSSNSGSRRFWIKARNGEFGGNDSQDWEEEKLNESNDHQVLPSPIPWRSRSARIEMKEEVDSSPPLYTSLSPSMEESEFNRSFRSQMARANCASSSPRLSPSPSLSSPKKLSPSPFLSSESQAKSAEDLVRKKTFYRPSPPPPPPPPPPLRQNFSSVDKDSKRSFTTEPRNNSDGLSMGKSVRTTRTGDPLNGAMKDKELEDGINVKAEKRWQEVEANPTEKWGRIKAMVFEQTSFKNEKLNPLHESVTFKEFPKEDFDEKVEVEADEDSESEDEDDDDNDEIGGRSCFVKGVSGGSSSEETAATNASDGGPDVDKKADEFIAKFREQIRLQRIESIKRTSAQIRKSSRQS